MQDLPRATAEKIAKLLVERLRGLSREESIVVLKHALFSTTPADIVAITQFMPPELRDLMPRKHLH
jgi:hypothetical protein